MRTRAAFRLSLRKEKLETLIFEKRLKSSNPDKFFENELSIDIKNLNIDPGLDDFFEANDDKESMILKLLQDNDKEIVKYALSKVRKYSEGLTQNQDGEINLDDDVFHMITFYLIEDADLQIKVRYRLT